MRGNFKLVILNPDGFKFGGGVQYAIREKFSALYLSKNLYYFLKIVKNEIVE